MFGQDAVQIKNVILWSHSNWYDGMPVPARPQGITVFAGVAVGVTLAAGS